MFKKKFLGILLALLAVVLIPSFVLAQTTDDEMQYEDTTYEDTSIDYNFDSDLFDDQADSTYEYTYEPGDPGAAAAVAASIFGGMMLLTIGLPLLITYIYTGLTYSKIAKKLNHPKPWFAWVPILNIVLHFQLGQMSPWFVLLMFVPIANIVVYVMAMMNICERMGMEKLLGLLAIVPIANYVLLGILAWQNNDGQAQPPQQQPPQQPVQQAPPQQPVQQTPQQQQSTNEESYLKPQQTPNTPTGA